MMNQKIRKVLEDKKTKLKLQKKLPKLFYMAELESSRAGRIGMEVGSLRERIIVAFLMYRFGEENVNSNLSITLPETDVILFDTPISIKTMTTKSIKGFKLSWTVDEDSAMKFQQIYKPECDVIYIQLNWGDEGGFYYIPKIAQDELIERIGLSFYLKLPKKGTNPRGIEISKDALEELVGNHDTIKIPIFWENEEIEFNPYERWIELWKQD